MVATSFTVWQSITQTKGNTHFFTSQRLLSLLLTQPRGHNEGR